MVLLTKNRALGPNRHRNQIMELFEEIRLSLAMALFNWSAQRSLPKTIIAKLLQMLSKHHFSESSGEIDDTELTILMAILYSYDTDILQKQDDNRLINYLHIIKDNDFVQYVYNTLMNNQQKGDYKGIKSVVQFSFGLAISGLRRASIYLQNPSSIESDFDELLVDDAIYSNVFQFLYNSVLEKDILYKFVLQLQKHSYE